MAFSLINLNCFHHHTTTITLRPFPCSTTLKIYFVCFPGKPQQVQVVEYTEKSQDKHESRHVQLVREYGFHPRSKVQVVDGGVLPRKFEPFPENMYGRPLEEIDNFIYEEVSKQVLRMLQFINFLSIPGLS